VVFEKTEDGTVKKICRYQQFRAVNRIVERVLEGKHRQGLIWHTQGSGKSLTMVFAALKLKTHRTIVSEALTNPNILVLTDRVDLHTQISGTFVACGLPNPTPIDSIKDLHALIRSGKDGHTALSTIFKFQGSKEPVENSENWIVMVDEAHRTQEKDLGAYLRATLPKARFFGFTGTPVKKDDKNTYANFGVVGESYLDKYGIDDAVADGATVPIYYTGRKTDWHIDEAKIDILFDTWFAEFDDDKLNEIKKRGVRIEDLVRHPRRIEQNGRTR
jgi:type I restriction enzyme R subunit